MDMGQEQGMGAPGQDGVSFCITVQAGKVTVSKMAPTTEGQEMPIGDALKMVLDAYEQSEPGESDAAFEAGFNGGTPEREPKPTSNGRMMAA